MKLTPWFQPTELPAHPGVYEVSVHAPETRAFDPAYSRWDGEKWNQFLSFKDCGGTPDKAAKNVMCDEGCGAHRMFWRGVHA